MLPPTILSIESLDAKPFHELRYMNASPRGRAEVARLGFFRGRVASLPAGCDALVIASDLQGMSPSAWGGEPAVLLGVAVAGVLDELDLGCVGALLAGDLYSVPAANKRGGFGDVSSVWAAFAESCAWVVGVAGNHDDVGSVATSARVHLLDGDVVVKGGVRFGGVSFIAGNKEKKGRRMEEAQRERLQRASAADVLVLHEGPFGGVDCEGSLAIREAVIAARVPLVVCGHRPWSSPLVRLAEGVQVVNAHERVLVLS